MKKCKRTLALFGVALLVALYLLTLIFALIDSPWSFECLKVSVGLTIFIPVLLWIYLAMFRYIDQRRQSAAGADEKKERNDF